jgi:hypothetical protein
MTQPPEDQLKALWQGQDTETPTMTAMAIRALARNYGDHLRSRTWFGLGLVAFVVLIYGAYLKRAPNEIARAGDVIILAGLTWMAWRMLRRRPTRFLPPEASTTALIEFHRAELMRQRTSYGRILVTAAPLFFGAAMVVVGLQTSQPHASWTRTAPFFLLMALWFVLAYFVQRRQARRLAEQIAEMDDLAAR